MKPISSQTISLQIQADLRAYTRLIEPFAFNTFDERSSLTLNGDFIHFQMLIDSFTRDVFPSAFLDNYSTFAKSKNEFIQACKDIYKDDAVALAQIQQFEQTYTPEQALYWYTKNSFAYTLLNRALRTNDARLILNFRFFVIDLLRQLTENSSESFTEEKRYDLSPTYYVYRGQLISKHELNSLRKSLNNIISIKSFLSTTLNQQVALHYLGEPDDSNESALIPILVEIDLGNSNVCTTSNKPFANITKHSYFGEVEEEVLFMAGSYFRVSEVRRDEKHIWHVRLAILRIFDNPLDSNSKFGALYDYMLSRSVHPMCINRSEIGVVLFQSGKFDLAQTYYECLLKYIRNLDYVLEEIEDEDEHIPFSCTANESGGIQRFLRDLISQSSRTDKHRKFEIDKMDHEIMCFYVLGHIANEKGLFDLSTAYYNAVLQQTLPSFLASDVFAYRHYLSLRALCQLGLGVAYELNGKFKSAFTSYTKALHMFEEEDNTYLNKFDLFSDSPQVYKAHCIVGLGNLSLIEQKFERANAHYQKALSLFDKYLPVGHPDQSRVRQKIANIVHIYRRKPAMALEDYEDCLENYLRSLPSDHVDIARVYTDMARSYEQLPNELDKALEYAKKAAIIFEQNLPKVHTDNVTIHMIIKRIQRKLTLEQ